MEASVTPSELDIKPDVKPPRRLATSYLGPPRLLRMLGAVDADHIIMKVLPGTDPLQDFEEADPSQTIVKDYETDASSDVAISLRSQKPLLEGSVSRIFRGSSQTLRSNINEWPLPSTPWLPESKTSQSNKWRRQQ